MPRMIALKFMLVSSLCFVSVGWCLAGDTWEVRTDGVGPVKVGMSLSQLNAVVHEKFSLPAAKDEQGCFYIKPHQQPSIGLMIEDGRVTRVDIDGPDILTVEGVHVGDSETRAKQVYGHKLKVEPHAYTGPEGHYLTMHSSDGRYGIRFETDEGKIVRFYAGRANSIAYIEGCQ